MKNLVLDTQELLDFRDKLPVKQTKRDKLWSECVAEAREYLKYRTDLKMKIVDLALKCCDRFHGGRTRNSLYSLKRFAEEIGIKRPTLSEWIRIKELVLDELPPEKRNHGVDFYHKMMTGLKHETPAAEVEKRFDKLNNMSDAQYRFEKYLMHLKSIHFNAIRPLNMRGVKKGTLSEIAQLCSEIGFHIDKFLDPKPNRIKESK